MVVRRIRDHVATHNWFAVAIDLAIVVVGVFLGTPGEQLECGADRTPRGASVSRAA